MKSILITGVICFTAFFSVGQTIKAFTNNETGFMGFKNAKGEIIIEPSNKYDDWGGASEGLILVAKKEKWGFIDLKGNTVIELKYRTAEKFSEGLAEVSLKKGNHGYIDKTGTIQIELKYSVAQLFSEGVAAVKMEDKFGFIDKAGNTVINFKYQLALFFKEGLVAVQLNDKWGFIDKSGREICPLKYDGASVFSEGFAPVNIGRKFTFIDKTGKQIIEPTYDYIEYFKNGFAAVKLNEKWGFINRSGKEIVFPAYAFVDPFKEGFAKLYYKDSYYQTRCKYTNEQGVLINNKNYTFASGDFVDGFAIVEEYSGGKGVIDNTGKTFIPTKYESLTYSAGVFTAKDYTGEYKFDKPKNIVVAKPVQPVENIPAKKTPVAEQIIDDENYGLSPSVDIDAITFKIINFSENNFSDSSNLKWIDDYLAFKFTPEKAIVKIDQLIAEAAKNKTVYKECCKYLYAKYRTEKQGCNDAIIVQLTLNYYCNSNAPYGGAYWIEKGKLDSICETSNRKKTTLCNAIIPDVSLKMLPLSNSNSVKLHDIKSSYTIVYFWQNECNSCNAVSKKLASKYSELRKKGVEIFGVSAEKDNMDKCQDIIISNNMNWINTIDIDRKVTKLYNVNTVPYLFLLDSNKKIILKNTTVDDVVNYLDALDEK